MKNQPLRLLSLSLWLLIFGALPAFAQQTADKKADHTTACILHYISGLSSQSGNKVISGQWMNHRSTLTVSPQDEFDTAITSIYDSTSEWVGLIGTDYMREFSNPFSVKIKNLKPVNQPLINYFRLNGLAAVMVSFDNPWTGKGMNDTTASGNLLDITTKGHSANTAFINQLDSVAAGLQQLQDSGVTVLFRPFHEMNGNWFWWGSKTASLPSASDFTSLWQFVFNYFTVTKNLHNILWLYTPSAKDGSVKNPAFKTELFYYPGDSFVDIIGLDVYKDTLDIPNYTAIVAMGKPVGLAEFGPTKTGVTNMPFVYDYTTLINQVKNKYPALCFWLSWNHFSTNKGATNIYYSLSTQKNTSALLQDSLVANRADIAYSGCLTTAVSQATPSMETINIFPNPFHFQTVLQSEYPLTGATLTLFNCQGQAVKKMGNIKGETVIVSRDDLAAGLYFLRLSEGNQVITKKLIIAD